MKEFIDKLIERLEEEISWYETHGCNEDLKRGIIGANRHAIDLVNQLAEEYKGGWIPCSERLPSKEEYLKDDGRFIVTDGNRRYQSVFDIYSQVFRTSVFGAFGSYRYEEDKCVIAWQPLPAPYKEGE